MRRALLICLLFLAPVPMLSCDVCSIPNSGDLLLRRNRLTYLFRFRELRSETGFSPKTLGRIKHLEQVDERGGIRELCFVQELRGTLLLGEQMNMTIGIPVVTNYRSVNGFTSADLSGVGDAWILLQRDILSLIDNVDEWRWMLGLGLKLPLAATHKK